MCIQVPPCLPTYVLVLRPVSPGWTEQPHCLTARSCSPSTPGGNGDAREIQQIRCREDSFAMFVVQPVGLVLQKSRPVLSWKGCVALHCANSSVSVKPGHGPVPANIISERQDRGRNGACDLADRKFAIQGQEYLRNSPFPWLPRRTGIARKRKSITLKVSRTPGDRYSALPAT
jgi:hypothetical protein